MNFQRKMYPVFWTAMATIIAQQHIKDRRE